jgi:hypothetical protein
VEDQEIVELLKDPVKFACVIHCLLSIKNLDDVMKEHSELEVFKIACEATRDAYRGEAS